MADPNLVQKPVRRSLPGTLPPESTPLKQRRLMVGALVLLLAALGLLLYADRDFWFPETQEVDDQPESVPVLTSGTASVRAMSKNAGEGARATTRRRSHSAAQEKEAIADASVLPVAITERTVLPPLEVEVVAGDMHRKLHPAANSVQVDLLPDSRPATPPVDTAAGVTRNASDRVPMPAKDSELVTESVTPDYPMLARQMKVQGSVILQALIGRDGLIQNLHVVSGPPILAHAAEEAVKRWHFKPHYQGAEAVETQAKITVNFTISTN